MSKPPQKNEKVQNFLTGPIEPRVHDVAKLRSMLNKRNEPEEEHINIKAYLRTDDDEKQSKKSKIEKDIQSEYPLANYGKMLKLDRDMAH